MEEEGGNGTSSPLYDNSTASYVSTGVVVLNVVTSLWIITVNAFVIVSFAVYRKNFANAFTVHLLSLSATDFLAGCFALPAVMTHGAFTTGIGFASCYIKLVPMLMSQGASMSHIIGICVHRLFITFKKTRFTIDKRWIAGHVIVTWLVAVVTFVPVPLLICDSCVENFNGNVCSLNVMFGASYRKIIRLWISMFLIPLVLTNGLYIGMCVRLRHTLRTVRPVIGPVGDSQPQGTAEEGDDSEPPTENEPRGQTQDPGPPPPSNNQHQVRVFVTIGIILLLLDMCLVPFVTAFVVEGLQVGVTLSREAKFLLAYLVQLNAAINPVVYILRVKVFRVQLREMVTICRTGLRNLTRQLCR